MKANVRSLAEVVGKEVIITIDRKPVDRHLLHGFVVGLSDSLLLLHLMDGNTLTLNGYSAVRLRDVRRWRVDTTFVLHALRLRELRPEAPEGVDLADLPALLASADARFPLVMVGCEKKRYGIAYIGKVKKLTVRHLRLKSVDPQAQWADVERCRLKDITQVEFGDGYTTGLADLMAHEADAMPEPG